MNIVRILRGDPVTLTPDSLRALSQPATFIGSPAAGQVSALPHGALLNVTPWPTLLPGQG